ncbi:Fiber protein Fb15 [Quillaja saponaria]|uniref:Fiber protein Fb15 n=1 Tax=Quillaja saponaria TaxID=32244 RepID=A0AAD7QD98_QUISA|nr:Fiber protein Fb15 [Quillaja saponaria]
MALRSFYNEIKGLKVKELPNHVKPLFSIDYVKKSVQKGLDNYHAKNGATLSISNTPRNMAAIDLSVSRLFQGGRRGMKRGVDLLSIGPGCCTGA